MRDGHAQPRILDFYIDVVLPALAERLDAAFPEFGWRRDRRGWVATNNEMTHRVLGVRADRVFAHGPAPRGILIHGADPVLWTAYVNGGTVPRGRTFAQAVAEIARRAGVDAAPLERREPPDRRAELLSLFFALAREELNSPRAQPAREYLKQRGITPAASQPQLGVIPSLDEARTALLREGFTDAEIRQAAVLADSRWTGRLCGAWRDERGRVKTLWARGIDDTPQQPRNLYLANALRSNLPPYGLSDLAGAGADVRGDLTLVEGILDVHQLRSRSFAPVAAAGGAGASSFVFEKLAQLGVESLTLCFDGDDAGRTATARSIDHAARATHAPQLFVLDPEHLAPANDPDEFVRTRGLDAWRAILNKRECAIAWRTHEFLGGVTPDSETSRRRDALARAGAWLGTLPPRLALEQEDAVAAAAKPLRLLHTRRLSGLHRAVRTSTARSEAVAQRRVCAGAVSRRQ
jgi:DNA primase